MEPLVVRLLLPLGVAIILFFVTDFVLTFRLLARRDAEVSAREKRRIRIRGIAGLLLITLLSMAATITFAYRKHVSERRVREQEAATPGDARPRQALRRQIQREKLALFVPIIVGGTSGLTLRRLERSKQRGAQDDSRDPTLRRHKWPRT